MTAVRSSIGARKVVGAAAACAATSVAIAVATAVTIKLGGVADDARRALRFGFDGLPSANEGARVALNNARIAAAVLLCAALAPRLTRHARTVADIVLATVLLANAIAVGVAFGAYGSRLARAIAPHLPLELAAMSLAGGAYIHARTRPLQMDTLAALTAVCALLVIAAAMLETYVAAGGSRWGRR